MKKLYVFLIMLIALCLVSACNSTKSAGTNANTKNSKEASATDEKIEIKFWYAWGDKIGETNKNLAKMFNESQNKIHVTAEYQGTSDELEAKTQAAFAAKNAPEVTLNANTSIAVFAKSGMIQDLTPFVERDKFDLKDFNPGLMGNSYVDGKLYSLPYFRSTPILYMNASMLKEAGLNPTGPKNWAEFENYLRALTKEGKTVGMTMPVSTYMFEAFVAQGGGKILSDDKSRVAFNEKAGVEALAFWKKLKKEGLIKVPGGEDATKVKNQDFANGRAAMMFESSADLSYHLGVAKEQGFELNTAFMPSDKVQAVTSAGTNIVMISGLDKEKQNAAWEFIKWMTAKEQTVYASSHTGYLPSRFSANETEEMRALYKEKPQFKVGMDQLQYAQARPMAKAYPEIMKIISDAISRTLLKDDLAPQGALDAAAEKANQLLQK